MKNLEQLSHSKKFGSFLPRAWIRKRVILSVLLPALAILFVWFWYFPSIISIAILITFVILSLLLGICGIITIHFMSKHPSKMGTHAIATLVLTVLLVVVVITAVFWIIDPVLSVPPEPPMGPEEFCIKIDRIAIEGYSIEGGVKVGNFATTIIRAKNARADGLNMIYGTKEIYGSDIHMEDLVIHCTYMGGTGEALGISVHSAWRGHEKVPIILSLLGDPLEMTNVTIHANYLSAGHISFGEMAMGGSDSTSEIPFAIEAGTISMKLELGLSEIIRALSGTMELKAKDTVIYAGSIKLPSLDSENMSLSFDKSTIGSAKMKLALSDALRMMLQDPASMVRGLKSGQIELSDINLMIEEMEAENVTFDQFSMKRSSNKSFERTL